MGLRSFSGVALAGMACAVVPHVAVGAAATDGSVELKITPIQASGTYAPKHILAIWVTDASDHYVKTIRREGTNTGRWQWLSMWNTARGGDTTVDGTTTATTTSFVPITATWDCTDRNGNIVPDGDYRLRVEFTSAHAQGPYTPLDYFEFTKGPQGVSFQPANLTNYKNMSLTFAAIPEPLAAPVLAFGSLMLMRRRRRAR